MFGIPSRSKMLLTADSSQLAPQAWAPILSLLVLLSEILCHTVLKANKSKFCTKHRALVFHRKDLSNFPGPFF